MRCFKKLDIMLSRLFCDIRKIKFKHSLIVGAIYFIIGAIVWFFGGNFQRIMLLFIFPKSALPLFIMYILWGVSHFACGFIFGAVIFSCDKYRRQLIYRICIALVLMQTFTFISYMLFFGANAPFVAFLSFLATLFFCVVAILFCFRNFYSCGFFLILHFLWLLYNTYITLAFSIINWKNIDKKELE